MKTNLQNATAAMPSLSLGDFFDLALACHGESLTAMATCKHCEALLKSGNLHDLMARAEVHQRIHQEGVLFA